MSTMRGRGREKSRGWNWGLMLGVAFSLAVWTAAILVGQQLVSNVPAPWHLMENLR